MYYVSNNFSKAKGMNVLMDASLTNQVGVVVKFTTVVDDMLLSLDGCGRCFSSSLFVSLGRYPSLINKSDSIRKRFLSTCLPGFFQNFTRRTLHSPHAPLRRRRQSSSRLSFSPSQSHSLHPPDSCPTTASPPRPEPGGRQNTQSDRR